MAGFTNDEGYESGDELVQELAAQLKSTLSVPNMTLARISTSEFSFIVPNMEEGELRQFAEHIMDCVLNLNPN